MLSYLWQTFFNLLIDCLHQIFFCFITLSFLYWGYLLNETLGSEDAPL